MSEKLASVLEHFSLNKMNDDAGTLELINAISLERGYNKVQTGLFKVLQLSKLFSFQENEVKLIRRNCVKKIINFSYFFL